MSGSKQAIQQEIEISRIQKSHKIGAYLFYMDSSLQTVY